MLRCAVCIASIALTFVCADTVSAQAVVDGRQIEKLRWYGPPPGGPTDYWARTARGPVVFTDRWLRFPSLDTPAQIDAAPRLTLLVNVNLYSQVQASLDTYTDDLLEAGYVVDVASVYGADETDVKDWIRDRWLAGSEGVVLIGEIAAAWAEVSESVFPCDLYYMDLDGHWQDADGDGDYEIHTAGTGDEGPEIYVARMYTPTLDWASEPSMLDGYLAKAHAYRQCTLTQPYRGLEYVDEDWHDMYVALDRIFGTTGVVRHDIGHLTTAAGYLNNLALGQHFVQVCAHSWCCGHAFGKAPAGCANYAHIYVYSPIARAARLRLGSDDGLKVWFNGENVLTRDVYQGWSADQWTVIVTLNAGWNRLLCKVSQGGGDHMLSARFSDAAGDPLPDLLYSIDNPDTATQEAPFVRAWLLNGFHQDTSDNFWSYLSTNYLGVSEAAANPTEGQYMGGHTWTKFVSDGGYVDLTEHIGGADFGATYAFVRVYAETATNCELWLGYDDGVRVWLNGAQVAIDNRYGDYELDMMQANVSLSAGENRLMVKVSEWMGPHGFSARFCHSDGSPVTGLTYDPETPPKTYIDRWLLNGPYGNTDPDTRLSTDYLGGEADVMPSAGDPAPGGVWFESPAGSGCPVDLKNWFAEDGGRVLSEDIQDHDPPVLFYNLFSCGPGRFTEPGYLAGSYIFNTSYGLITVASSKSGSMLHFEDFTQPIADGRSVGQAFLDWFDAQAPFQTWEREWYYGMVLNGDPSLYPVRKGDANENGIIDSADVEHCQANLLGPAISAPGGATVDMNIDGDVDLRDCAAIQRIYMAGAGRD